VVLTRLNARLNAEDGPARVSAPSGQYDMDSDVVHVAGPVVLTSARGFALDSKTIEVNLKARTIATTRPVSGKAPLGTFSADSLFADISGRRVLMEGHAKLKIRPGAGTGGR
jgi:lipopolysaccharide export system protein LptC